MMSRKAVVLPLSVLSRLTILRERGVDPAKFIQAAWRNLKKRRKAVTDIARTVRGYVVRSVREYGTTYDYMKRLYYRQGYGTIARWRLNSAGYFNRTLRFRDIGVNRDGLRDRLVNERILRRQSQRGVLDFAMQEQIREESESYPDNAHNMDRVNHWN
ncbi:MAG: hypothetical protein CMJ58_14175 [Planctomycetaceae bacterium]|nr:hypothetical protein [Planctomycetaceae bacterium]